MLELSRTVRFCINSSSAGKAEWGTADNSFAAYPSMRGLGRYYELQVRCRGEVDPATGYFLNIKQVDEAVRTAAIPAIESACRSSPQSDPAVVLRDALPALNQAVGGRVASVRWLLTPYYSIEMSPPAPAPAASRSPATTGDPAASVVLMRQVFDFAASHRLHSPKLSDDENRRIFGKCNNPRGHGHNYRVEPCVAVRVPAKGPPTFTLQDLERIVNQTIVARYDHKNLNLDTPEFAVESGGLNPSVENIAKVCFDRLKPEIAAAAASEQGAQLRSVTVWETDKTSSTYPAPDII